MRKSLSLDYKNKNKSKSIDVLFYYNGRDQYARPVSLVLDSNEYTLGGVQFWYAEHKGGSLVHHYRVGDETGDVTFELSLETENLTWYLEKVEVNSAASSKHVLSSRVARGTYA